MTGDGASEPEDVVQWLQGNEPELVDDFARLRRLLSALDRYQLERWQRHVSAGDRLIDRWERAAALGLGNGSSIYDSALVIGDVQVCRNTWIGPNTVLDGSGGLVIGDWCSISVGVQIYSHDSVARALSGGVAPARRNATAIGSNTYVGPNAIITGGVRVGSRCVIGAMSLVLDDIPDGSVAHGIPALVAGSSDRYLDRPASPPDQAES